MKTNLVLHNLHDPITVKVVKDIHVVVIGIRIVRRVKHLLQICPTLLGDLPRPIFVTHLGTTWFRQLSLFWFQILFVVLVLVLACRRWVEVSVFDLYKSRYSC